MESSTIISILALIVSVIALGHTIKSKYSDNKIIFSQQNGSLRIQVQQLTFELTILIDRILISEDFNEKTETLRNLVHTAEGLAEIYINLGEETEYLTSAFTEISVKYQSLSSQIKEFANVLHHAKENLDSEKYAWLLNSSKGLNKRIWNNNDCSLQQ